MVIIVSKLQALAGIAVVIEELGIQVSVAGVSQMGYSDTLRLPNRILCPISRSPDSVNLNLSVEAEGLLGDPLGGTMTVTKA